MFNDHKTMKILLESVYLLWKLNLYQQGIRFNNCCSITPNNQPLFNLGFICDLKSVFKKTTFFVTHIASCQCKNVVFSVFSFMN